MEQWSFKTSVVTAPALLALSESVQGWRKRDCYPQLVASLHSTERDRVCLLLGLRRTGKATLLRQTVLDMTPEAAEKTAYIKASKTNTIADLNRDMERLQELSFRYILLDEVTLMRDFIDSAALLSDIYAAQGMKIVLSGTDSLGFWFALHQELHDRAKEIHTTFIPYREHSRLLKIDQIDEYVCYGGTLRVGELAFDDADVNAEDASFRGDESTRRYIGTAICRNIQHSLTYDREENCYAAFEIKRSRQAAPEQTRHLRDAEKCALTERRFGKLVGKYVLYLGERKDTENDIVYRNAEEFLKELPLIQLYAHQCF